MLVLRMSERDVLHDVCEHLSWVAARLRLAHVEPHPPACVVSGRVEPYDAANAACARHRLAIVSVFGVMIDDELIHLIHAVNLDGRRVKVEDVRR